MLYEAKIECDYDDHRIQEEVGDFGEKKISPPFHSSVKKRQQDWHVSKGKEREIKSRFLSI